MKFFCKMHRLSSEQQCKQFHPLQFEDVSSSYWTMKCLCRCECFGFWTGNNDLNLDKIEKRKAL